MAGHQGSAPQTGFLNVDLDITCLEGLDAPIEALSANMLLLVRYENFASFEVNEQFDNPSDTILRMADIVDGLELRCRAFWNNANQRVLNVGVESPASGAQQIFDLKPHAVSRAAEIGASVAFTVYAR